MARDDVQVNFRMPADLKRRLEASAEVNGRTLTAELVFALEMAYPDFLPQARQKFRRIFSLVDGLAPDGVKSEKKEELKAAIDDYLSFMNSEKVWLSAEALAQLDDELSAGAP